MISVPVFATYDDLLDAPEHVVGESLDGVLHTHPRPAPRHANAATALSGAAPFDVAS